MPIINLDYDLANVASEFEALPEGQYLSKIVSAELTKASTGKDMIKVTWEVVDGEYEGRKLFDNIVITPGAEFKMKQYAVLAGIESGAAIDTQDFIDAEGLVTIIQKEFEGEIRNNIKKVQASS